MEKIHAWRPNGAAQSRSQIRCSRGGAAIAEEAAEKATKVAEEAAEMAAEEAAEQAQSISENFSKS